MKLLVITEICGVTVNDGLSQLVKDLSVQGLEINYYNPRAITTVTENVRSFASGMVLNNLSDVITTSDYIILDSRMANEIYDISLGMLYANWLDRVYVYDNEGDFTELKTALQNRKTNEPFDSDTLLVTGENYEQLFYRLVCSSVNTLTIDQSVVDRFNADYKLIGLIWTAGVIRVVANIDNPNPYLAALLNRC